MTYKVNVIETMPGIKHRVFQVSVFSVSQIIYG